MIDWNVENCDGHYGDTGCTAKCKVGYYQTSAPGTEHYTCDGDTGAQRTGEWKESTEGGIVCELPCNGDKGAGVNATPPRGLPHNASSWHDMPGDCNFQLQSQRTCAPGCGPSKSPAGYYLVRKHYCQNGTLTRGLCSLCSDRKCANLGRCVSNFDDSDRYSCDCTEGWSGQSCEISDPCIIERPCENGGTCRDVSTNGAGYVCDCPVGFAGINCETLITVWHTLCCIDKHLSCPVVGQNRTVPKLLRDAPQTQHLCSVLSLGDWVLSVLVSGLIVCISLWIYRRLLLCKLRPIKLWLVAVVSGGSCVCMVTLATLLYEEYQASVNLTGTPALVGLVCLTLPVQVTLAGVWHTRWQHCRRASNSVTNRLWRGAMIPSLAVVTACPATILVMTHNRQTLAFQTLKNAADGTDCAWVVIWLGLSYGVIVTTLPLAAVVGRLYMPHREPSQQLLADNAVHRGQLFVWAYRGYAQLSGLLFPLWWIPYMANELQVFCNSINDDGDSSDKIVSVDGVRALSPIVMTMNLCAVVGFALAVASFPAAQLSSPFLFVGIGWGLMIVSRLVLVTIALFWALAEPKTEAIRRHTQVQTMRQNLLRNSFSDMLGQHKRKCFGAFNWSFEFVMSWQGQTLFSTVNHLAAIVLFAVGIARFSIEMRGTPIRRWLVTGVILSLVGLLTSAISLIERKWPWLKLTPTDDSFRLACVLKVCLVMIKAMVVFLLAGVDGKSAEFELWEDVVSIICFASLAILALMTAAFAVVKVWKQPQLLEKVGVSSPRTFIHLYAVSYVGCKLATIFFMAQGHLPSWFGCGGNRVTFRASKEFGINPHSDAISCSICYPSATVPVNTTSNELTTPCESTEEVYYSCSSSCIQLFYSGNPESIDLITFVLLPLLWLPFAVYANNEMAQLIDGTWWQHLNAGMKMQSSIKVGLSSTADGYYTVAPLVQAVTIACGVILIWFVSISGGIYQIPVPQELLNAEEGQEMQHALYRSGCAVTICAVLLNATMVSRVLCEICIFQGFKAMRRFSRNGGVELQTHLVSHTDAKSLQSHQQSQE
eukprot:COSAG01_NODE_4944_length_4602_cov_10.905841_1_plen_1050_part_00